ncbi:MAG: SNF2-related protein [Desulfobacterium sp.]|nr:SNF2-related protein [Desulfobacterium sp.]
MKQLKKGQRFTSEMEPELGLGTLVAADLRTMTVNFAASSSVRRYSTAAAPLKRVRFEAGDTVLFGDNSTMVVETVDEVDGLLVYSGGGNRVTEEMLADTMSLSGANDRLRAGMFDPVETFDLRLEANRLRYDHETSEVMGFMGGRVDLIPHQFYIAGEVANRYLPRVLLADETGLGKTIEACLVLHRLLLSERISRVLILVPESLVHQWFVELYRRFNLAFRIFDQALCRDLEQSEPGSNPFFSEQLAICSLDEAANDEKNLINLVQAQWDMVVVDEAHHLEEGGSAYLLVEALARAGAGMMLLSATPEQLGQRNHFSHLRLLDPDRYTSFDDYVEESRRYRQTASALDGLAVGGKYSREIDELLDCHGPGRAVFRNTRAVIKGFPRRQGILYPLAKKTDMADSGNSINPRGPRGVSSLTEYGEDGVFFAKVKWLKELLKSLNGKKVLLICAAPEKAAEIEAALGTLITMKIARFTEDMTLIQRDRSAAWFSETPGAQLMICSEIGSEGRNFQFAHHLVMFDLPENPELVEQRIGRLDRIGQVHPMVIHVPHSIDSRQAVLARWYKEGTGIFEKNISGIHQIHQGFKERLAHLSDICDGTGRVPLEELDLLIHDTRTFAAETFEILSKGRDRLLELNSFRPRKAEQLITAISSRDKDQTLDLFMAKMFRFYSISPEPIIERTYRLELFNASGVPFPGFKGDGMVVTFDRKIAVVRDDIHFLTWDHPMVTGAMELFLGSDHGNAALGEIHGTGKFAILLESVYTLECLAPKELHMSRFLARTPIRTLVDHNLSDVIQGRTSLLSKLSTPARSWLGEFPEIKERLLPDLLAAGRRFAEQEAVKVIAGARESVEKVVGGEAKRLARLRKINPAIREDEIHKAEEEAEKLVTLIDRARLRLDSLRLIKVS